MTQWLLPLYKWIGAGHPKASLVVMFLIGGIIFGGMWFLTGREYQESLKKAQSATMPESLAQPENVPPKTEVKSAEVKKEKQKPPVKKAAQLQSGPSPAVVVEKGAKWNSHGDTVYAPDRTAIENKGELTSNDLRVNPPTPRTNSEQLDTFIASSADVSDSQMPFWSQWVAGILKNKFSEQGANEFLSQPSLAKKREFLKRLKDSIR
jgi:hypothetical protein